MASRPFSCCCPFEETKKKTLADDWNFISIATDEFRIKVGIKWFWTPVETNRAVQYNWMFFHPSLLLLLLLLFIIHTLISFLFFFLSSRLFPLGSSSHQLGRALSISAITLAMRRNASSIEFESCCCNQAQATFLFGQTFQIHNSLLLLCLLPFSCFLVRDAISPPPVHSVTWRR